MMKSQDNSRFDTRLPKKQKELFEQAASLGGFRSLTDFILYAAQQQAEKIMERHNEIALTKRETEIFFQAVTEAPEPNAALQKAAERYNKLTKAQ